MDLKKEEKKGCGMLFDMRDVGCNPVRQNISTLKLDLNYCEFHWSTQ